MAEASIPPSSFVEGNIQLMPRAARDTRHARGSPLCDSLLLTVIVIYYYYYTLILSLKINRRVGGDRVRRES